MLTSNLNVIRDVEYARYGERALQLDLYIPQKATSPSGLFPVVAWFVGGGWMLCDRKVVAPLFLTEHGIAVASVTYRVSAAAKAPASVHDAKAAIRFLRANAARYGFDPGRIGAFGQSSGGHLALMTALTPHLPELEGDGGNPGVSSAVTCVADFCAPTDLLRIAEPDLRANYSMLHDLTEKYLGGPIADKAELARLLSPISHVTKSAQTPPLLIIHGRKDSVVPISESERLHAALQAAGADAEFFVVEDGEHVWNWKLTRERAIDFFLRTL